MPKRKEKKRKVCDHKMEADGFSAEAALLLEGVPMWSIHRSSDATLAFGMMPRNNSPPPPLATLQVGDIWTKQTKRQFSGKMSLF